MSEPVVRTSDEGLRSSIVPLEQEFEGIGRVRTYFLDLERVALQPPPVTPRTLAGQLIENVGVLLRAFPYRFGIRKPRFALAAATNRARDA